ncbi:hypothetical protein M2447_001413 [Ereboglobus sp. PH5-10]|uniref:AsmA-like C-terminal region-containing protein n=1 Tax=Ereboglobus sp. PH5-10 TaxID=2940629 RepID=UPI002407231E|nr:AsmA-like C-terminal region-containing protein [Ereboglobus sp. PH5-10]MDF9827321.1 hypothetical protein [Ereboglobus sp. PH5-10]
MWLALAALLLAQARIATADEITIPDAVLRRVEQRLAEHGLRLTFGAIHCDSSGHVVARDLKLFSSLHPDPVLTANAVRFEINLPTLLLHNIAPRLAGRIDGASLRVPAMLSNDGTNAAAVDRINAEVELKSSVLSIKNLSARAGNLAVLCRGELVIPKTRAKKRGAAEALSDAIASYLKTVRALNAWTQRLDALDNPVLDITFTPDAKQIASARVELMCGGLHPGDIGRADADASIFSASKIELGPLLARATVDVGGLVSTPRARDFSVQLSTASAAIGNTMRARNARLRLTMPMADILSPASRKSMASGVPPVVNLSLACSAESLAARGITARSFTARADGRLPQTLRASITTRVLGEPVAFETEVDFAEKKADARISTRATPLHIAAISREVNYDLGEILKPARPIEIDAAARLGAGWRFAGARGALDIGPINADNVAVDRARGTFAYDHAKRVIVFSPASAAVGESFARGSFETNFKTLDFRFLLTGRLRPSAINGWFGKWWPSIWNDFTFNDPPPHGDVDVRGNWKNTSLARVFVFADATGFTYEKVAVDHALLTLFVRPDYCDALDLFARRGNGYARGTFTHQSVDPGDRTLLTVFDFKGENIDPVAVAPAISPALVDGLSPVRFEKPPARLRAAGRIDGPAAPRGEHTLIDVEVEGDGAFSYEQIPLTSLSASLRVRDDALTIDRLRTQFAGGHLTLKAQVSGADNARRLGFDMNLNGASFGRAFQMVEEISARKRGVAAPPDEHYNQPANAQMDLRFSADGFLSDSLSFKGNGSAEVSGAELVNINIFGELSQALRDVKVLNFTSLNLTDGQFNFTLDGRRVVIPEAVLTGQKAHVKLNGEYTLDTRFANLTAKVYPLSESRGIIGKGLGFLLVPVTHLTELRLTGSLDAPKWRFSYGPTSILRALIGKSGDTESLEQEHAKKSKAADDQEKPSATPEPQPLSMETPAETPEPPAAKE